MFPSVQNGNKLSEQQLIRNMERDTSQTQTKKFDSSFSSYDIFLHLPFNSLHVLCSNFRSSLLMKGENISGAEVMICHVIYL